MPLELIIPVTIQVFVSNQVFMCKAEWLLIQEGMGKGEVRQKCWIFCGCFLHSISMSQPPTTSLPPPASMSAAPGALTPSSLLHWTHLCSPNLSFSARWSLAMPSKVASPVILTLITQLICFFIKICLFLLSMGLASLLPALCYIASLMSSKVHGMQKWLIQYFAKQMNDRSLHQSCDGDIVEIQWRGNSAREVMWLATQLKMEKLKFKPKCFWLRTFSCPIKASVIWLLRSLGKWHSFNCHNITLCAGNCAPILTSNKLHSTWKEVNI